MMATKQVEVLVFEGCPNVDTALQRARSAVDNTNVRAEVRLARVESDDDAKRRRFLGSPTVRVDGVDVDESARGRSDFGLQCRVYSVAGRFEGAPPVDWIATALLGELPERHASGPFVGAHVSTNVAVATELAATLAFGLRPIGR